MSTWDWQVFCKDTIDNEVRPSCFGQGGDITYLDWLLSAWGWTLSVAVLALVSPPFIGAYSWILVLGNNGWLTRKAPNARIPGWSNVHSYLAMRDDLGPDEEPRPYLRVFRDCKYVIEQLAEVPIAPHDPEDIDTTSDDHGADSVRYLLQGRPIRAVKKKRLEQMPGSILEAKIQSHMERLRKRGRRHQ